MAGKKKKKSTGRLALSDAKAYYKGVIVLLAQG